MKVVTRTPTLLILHDSAMTLRVLGGVLAGIGAVAIWVGCTQDPEGQLMVAPIVIGSLMASVGALMFALPKRKTFAFSKAERVFVLAKERFGRVERETIPLRDIKDVWLEDSTSSEGGSTYRVSMTLADERRIPWTSYYSSGVAAKQAIIEMVRQFLELDPVPALGSGAPTELDQRNARRGRFALVGMGVFCSIFLAVGLTMAVKQERRLSLFQPVTATVLGTRVDTHTDSDGSTYEPVVVYSYRVGDRQYTASRVTPLEESRGGGWARRVTDGYRVGSNYTAFYDPTNPAEAFLMRKRSLLPWAFIGIPLVAILLIGASYRSTRELERMSRWPR